MILLRKVISLKSIYSNESHWLYTLQIYTVQKSRVTIRHTLMEISLNLIGFTDFFYKEMLTSLISFSSSYTFSHNLLLKASVVYAKNQELLQFFLRSQPYWLRDIRETSKWKPTTKPFSASTWFIPFDGICNYLHSFQKHPATNFFEHKCCFPDQEHVGHYINKSSETGLDFFIKYLLGPFNADFAALKASIVIIIIIIIITIIIVIISSSSCSSGGGSSSGSDSTSNCGSSSKILSWTDKYKLGAIARVRASKYNLGTRVGKCKVSVRVSKPKLEAWAGRHKLAPGSVNTN